MEIHTYKPGEYTPEDLPNKQIVPPLNSQPVPPPQAVQPPPNGQPPQAPVPPAPSGPVYVQAPVIKQRRVGTFTLGLTLIILGILVPVALFFGGAAWRILQFAPVVLLCLGGEILLYAIRYKEEKFRYDGLSIFLVILITFSTLIGSFMVPIVSNAVTYSKRYNAVYSQMQQKAEDILDSHLCQGGVSIYEDGYTQEWMYILDEVPSEKDWPLVVRMNLHGISGKRDVDKATIVSTFAAVAKDFAGMENVEKIILEYTSEREMDNPHYKEDAAGSSAAGEEQSATAPTSVNTSSPKMVLRTQYTITLQENSLAGITENDIEKRMSVEESTSYR